jgi:hypothetical protein
VTRSGPSETCPAAFPHAAPCAANRRARQLGRVELGGGGAGRSRACQIEAADLPGYKIEELGMALMHPEDAMVELRAHFGPEPDDLNLDLGSLGNLLAD